jgi:hypothetical protein
MRVPFLGPAADLFSFDAKANAGHTECRVEQHITAASEVILVTPVLEDAAAQVRGNPEDHVFGGSAGLRLLAKLPHGRRADEHCHWNNVGHLVARIDRA